MKWIKTYEKFGYPESIDKYVNFLFDYILKEYDKWFFRKGLANQSFTNEIDFEKEGLKIDDDFPLRKIDLILKFTIEKWSSVTSSGYVSCDKNGDFKLEVRITTPKTTKSVNSEELKEEISSLLSHEFTHLYQLLKSDKDITFILRSYALYETLTEYEVESETAYIFLKCLYYLTKAETSAEMASFYKTGTNRMLPYAKWHPTFLKYMSEKNVDAIVDSLITEEYDGQYYRKLINGFVDYYENCLKKLKGTYDEEPPIMGIINLRGKSLYDFVDYFVNKFKKTSKKALYKYHKIKYRIEN